MLKHRKALAWLALLLAAVTTAASELRVDGERLAHAIHRMQQTVDSTPFSVANRKALRLLARRMRAAGMMTHVDDAGNLFGRVRGMRPLPPILIGSQIDAGAGDEQVSPAAAILAAIEVQQTLHDAGRVLNHPLEIVVWSNAPDVQGKPGDIAAHLQLVVAQEDFEEPASGAANRLLHSLLELDLAP